MRKNKEKNMRRAMGSTRVYSKVPDSASALRRNS
jgi:hypothetical protein